MHFIVRWRCGAVTCCGYQTGYTTNEHYPNFCWVCIHVGMHHAPGEHKAGLVTMYLGRCVSPCGYRPCARLCNSICFTQASFFRFRFSLDGFATAKIAKVTTTESAKLPNGEETRREGCPSVRLYLCQGISASLQFSEMLRDWLPLKRANMCPEQYLNFRKV